MHIAFRHDAATEAKTSVYRHLGATLPSMTLSADRYLISCGTRPLRPPEIPFDGVKVIERKMLPHQHFAIRAHVLVTLTVACSFCNVLYSMLSVDTHAIYTLADHRDWMSIDRFTWRSYESQYCVVQVFDSDQLLWGGVKDVPRDLIVVGAGMQCLLQQNVIADFSLSPVIALSYGD